MLSAAGDRKSLIKYTPLPLFQIAILLLLRFCEAASTFVIFPFLNEVRVHWLHLIDWPKEYVAPYFCNRWRWEKSWILCWLDGPSVDQRALESESDILLQDAIRQLASLVTVMFWSRMSDHIGRKPILLLGTLALAISNLSFGLSRSFWALVVR